MTTKEKISFMAACKDFFGLLPDQKPLQFGKELKALTNDDRVSIAAGLTTNGYNIDADTIVKAA